MSCNHQCDKCGGCSARDLSMTKEEIKVLSYFAEIPFLPIYRKISSELPIFLEKDEYSIEMYSNILLCLEKKGLITIDFDVPISGWISEKARQYPIIGSMALSVRGQNVLEILDITGTS